jgi:antitoxin ParD1/3/4
MNVSLTPELERLVNEKVASGMYGSASEVVREALRLLKERDQLREHRLAELKGNIAIGIEQADRGELMDGEEFFDQLLRENEEEARAKRKR